MEKIKMQIELWKMVIHNSLSSLKANMIAHISQITVLMRIHEDISLSFSSSYIFCSLVRAFLSIKLSWLISCDSSASSIAAFSKTSSELFNSLITAFSKSSLFFYDYSFHLFSLTIYYICSIDSPDCLLIIS